MGFLSCFGCGSSDQENPEPKANSAQQRLTKDEPSESETKSAPQINTRPVDSDEQQNSGELSEKLPPPKAEEADPTEALLNEDPQNSPQVPEQSFGLRHMISEEDIARRVNSNPASHPPAAVSIDPSATEEDRWFEAEQHPSQL